MLAAEGCEVVVPRGQGCCGALSMHAGRDEESLRFARGLIDASERARRRDRRQRRRLRLAPEGLRAPVPDDPGRARRFAAKVQRRQRVPGGARPRARRHPLERASPTTTPVTLRTPSASGASRARSCAASPGSTLAGGTRRRAVLRQRGDLQPRQPESADEIGERKVDNVLSTRRPTAGQRQPRLHAADPEDPARAGRSLPSAPHRDPARVDQRDATSVVTAIRGRIDR